MEGTRGISLAAACSLLIVPGALFAQASGRSAKDAAVQAEVTEASRLGELLYRYDQAAWHATDRMLEGLKTEVTPLMRGYIVLPGDGGTLDTMFYGEVDGRLVEMARYAVRGSQVVSGDWLPATARPPLSDAALRLVGARQAALDYAADRKLGFCAKSTPNTVVLPPDRNDRVIVYVLTPPESTDAYPLGGHHRLEVDPAGEVTAARDFLKSCVQIQYGRNRNGDVPAGMVVSHILDDHPTEVHAFASRYAPITLYVVTTENKAMWTVANGVIRYEQQVEN